MVLPFLFNCDTGITIIGLENPLTVGESASISCLTNEPASSIAWSSNSSELQSTINMNVMVLNYTIELVTDDMNGQMYNCRVVSENSISGNESAILSVKGIP